MHSVSLVCSYSPQLALISTVKGTAACLICHVFESTPSTEVSMALALTAFAYTWTHHCARRAVSCLPYLAWLTPNVKELLAIAKEVCCQSSLPFAPGPTLQWQAGSQHPSESYDRSLKGSMESQTMEHLLEEIAHCARIVLLQGEHHF